MIKITEVVKKEKAHCDTNMNNRYLVLILSLFFCYSQSMDILNKFPLPSDEISVLLNEHLKEKRVFILRNKIKLLPAVLFYDQCVHTGARLLFKNTKNAIKDLKKEVNKSKKSNAYKTDVVALCAISSNDWGDNKWNSVIHVHRNGLARKDDAAKWSWFKDYLKQPLHLGKIAIIGYSNKTYDVVISDALKHQLYNNFTLEQLKFIASLADKSQHYMLTQFEQKLYADLDDQTQMTLRDNYPYYVFTRDQQRTVGIDDRIDRYARVISAGCKRVFDWLLCRRL